MKSISFIQLFFFFLLSTSPLFAQIHLDNDQDVGIGTTNTNGAKVNLENTTNTKSFYLENTATMGVAKYGIENYVRDQGLGPKYGLYNLTEQNVGATASNSAYGIWNEVRNSTSDYNNAAFGIYNFIDSVGVGDKVGIHTEVWQKAGTGRSAIGFETRIYPKTGLAGGYLSHISLPAGYNNFAFGILSGINGGDGNPSRYAIYGQMSGTGGYAGYFQGDVHVSGTLTCPSDKRLKKNIRNLDNASAIIRKIQPKKYEFKNTNSRQPLPRGEQYGFLAQDMEAILPQVVRTIQQPNIDESGKPIQTNGADGSLSEIKGINYQALIPILVQGIKEQQSRIDQLELEVKQLKKK